MEIIRGMRSLKPGAPSVVTVGVFDGVHIGHQAIMRIVRSAATSLNVHAVAVTFDRNPEEVLHPSSVQYITTLRQKIRLIEEQGMDQTVVLPFDRRLLEMSAEDFIRRVIHEKLSAAKVVVGTNFAFGKGRAGDVKLLRRTGMELGFDAIAVSPIRVGNTRASSTAIRGLVAAGRIERAQALLGHPFALEGKVVAGEGIGRSLGFPTANLNPAEKQVVPGSGVYAVSVDLGGKRHIGVANIGTRPTLGGEATRIEVYIIGYSGNIYDLVIDVAFHHRLRSEVQFADVDALRAQIARDVERASRLVE